MTEKHPKTDITLLTEVRYANPLAIDWYIQDILDEDKLVTAALEKRGLTVSRTNWDNQHYDWTQTRFIVFRTPWDYFHRFEEFSAWLNSVKNKTKFINPLELVLWNLDKHYLEDLSRKSINIPPTIFIKAGDTRKLSEVVTSSGWQDSILKPAVSGSARHTYRINPENVSSHEEVYHKLISKESMLLQEFQQRVLTEGEVAYMILGGKYSHAVLKKAKPGDFRVQYDFGGSIENYSPTKEEILFAEQIVTTCKPLPAYARVDVIRDNQNNLCVSELELIEPELWFRKHPAAADLFADAVVVEIQRQECE